MKIFNQPVGRMYVVTIILLILLAAASSYSLGIFPYSLILAVAVAASAELLASRFYLKHRLRIPFSAIITGLIIGSIAPPNAYLVVITASMAAILSKLFIKVKSVNIFNPATVGLLAALAVFSVGDQWWAASNYNIFGMALTLAPILIISAYEARRLTASLAFIAATFVMAALLNGTGLAAAAILAYALGINYYFAFIMLSDPKTSPSKKSVQLAYGVSMALLVLGLSIFRVSYAFLVALLIGNLFYALYRVRRK